MKKDRSRQTNILHENRKLSSVTLFIKLNTESEHINAVNRIKNYHSTLILLCFCQYLTEKVQASHPECQHYRNADTLSWPWT